MEKIDLAVIQLFEKITRTFHRLTSLGNYFLGWAMFGLSLAICYYIAVQACTNEYRMMLAAILTFTMVFSLYGIFVHFVLSKHDYGKASAEIVANERNPLEGSGMGKRIRLVTWVLLIYVMISSDRRFIMDRIATGLTFFATWYFFSCTPPPPRKIAGARPRH